MPWRATTRWQRNSLGKHKLEEGEKPSCGRDGGSCGVRRKRRPHLGMIAVLAWPSSHNARFWKMPSSFIVLSAFSHWPRENGTISFSANADDHLTWSSYRVMYSSYWVSHQLRTTARLPTMSTTGMLPTEA